MGPSFYFPSSLRVLTGVVLLIVLVLVTSVRKEVYAQSAPQCTSNVNQINGLVSTPQITGSFGSSGICVVDQNAAFVPYKVPTYADLKSLYYDQVTSHDKIVKEQPLPDGSNQQALNLNGNKLHLYYVDGSLTINDNITGSGDTGIVFVKNTLTIGPIPNNKFTYGDATHGLVFVTGGNIIIDPTVTQIDSGLIAAGQIFTAGLNCTQNSVITSQLVVNGSLVSLNSAGSSSIKFCRSLRINNISAEVVNSQPKYLYLLKDILSEKIQKWAEVAGDTPIPTPGTGFCGDRVCSASENALTCPQDCASSCGDGFCTGSESCGSCSQDCGVCPPPLATGSVAYFNLSACPAGWSPYTQAQGRYIVDLPVGGTLGTTIGTVLSNQENRASGYHTHSVNDPGHTHQMGKPLGSGGVWKPGGNSISWGDTLNLSSSTTGISIGAPSGNPPAGTNAPYVQLLTCTKN